MGRHCFARYSRDARDAGGSLVGRAVAGDQDTDRHLDTDTYVRVTSRNCFLEQQVGAVALESRAQETSRDTAKAERQREARKDALSMRGSCCMVSFVVICTCESILVGTSDAN